MSTLDLELLTSRVQYEQNSYKVSRHVCNPHELLDKSTRSSADSKQLIEMSPTKTGSASLHSNFSTMLFIKILNNIG